MSKKLNLIISFDVEFSINGAFSSPSTRVPISKSLLSPKGDLGLVDVLSVLDSYDVKATFFTETLNSIYFGTEEMGQYAALIHQHGHDVQLHTHPCWMIFKNPHWKDIVSKITVQDSFTGMEPSEIKNILKYGLDVFAKWNIPRPIAFRAGNLNADRQIYSVLNELGFLIGSNISLPIFRPNDSELLIENCSGFFDNVLEIPVTSYESMGCRSKSLTITGTSFSEFVNVVESCVESGIENIIILSHIHEFIKFSASNNCKRNSINLKRLDKICRYIRQSNFIRTTTFFDLANDSNSFNNLSQNSQRKINTSLWPGVNTMIENILNDRFWIL